MTIKIPKKLQKKEFCFVKLMKKKKKPFEKDWTKKPYFYSDSELLKHLEDGGNYGVMCGFGKLIVVDFDKEEVQKKIIPKLPKTFTIKTGSGLLHKYFLSDNYDNLKILDKDKNSLADVQGLGKQVVGASSIHPNGNKYEVVDNSEIAFISYAELKALFSPYLEKKEVKTKEEREYPKDDLLEQVKSKIKIKDLLQSYGINTTKNPTECPFHSSKGGKCLGFEDDYAHCFHCEGAWNVFSLVKQKDNCNFKEALKKLVDIAGLQEEYEKQEEEQDFLNVYDDKELIDYEPPEEEWLIQNQIPKGEIGLLVGKRGDRKTFVALAQALCLASGKPFVEDEIPEKKKVLIIEYESGKPTIAKRIKLLKKGLGIEKEALDIKYISFSGLILNVLPCPEYPNKKFLQFKRLVTDWKPDLIIIDCFQRAVNFEVDKDNQKISEFFTEIIRPMTQSYGCSWLFIHHLRKGMSGMRKPEDPLDEVRGGSELVNYCRFVLMVSKPRYQEDETKEMIVFKVLKQSNSIIPSPKVIAFSQVDEGIEVTYEGEPAEVLRGAVRCANAIKEWLLNSGIKGEFRTAQVNEASESGEITFKKTLVSGGLSELVAGGFLEKVKRGIYKIKAAEQETLTNE